MKKYRVYLHGSSMTACYSPQVDVFAENEDDAGVAAKRKLTKRGGTFSDWSPTMFTVQKVERIWE